MDAIPGVQMALNGESAIALGDKVLRVRSGASSDVGRVRKVNEDSYLAQPPVFFVADGMGGHAHGDAASQTVIRVFTDHIEENVPSTPERILDAIHSSNDAVRHLSSAEDFGTAMSGTTLAGVAIVDAGDGIGFHWMAYNVGDSRIYTWDDQDLRQLSVDHSAVQEMVEAGLIKAADAEKHPVRNVITRAIGADEFVDADVWLQPATGTHVFLICSDGLTKELSVREMAAVLAGRADKDLAEVAGELVAAALAKGGRDNVTVVIVESTLD
jgi:serine/threonine protein phosphatase PrpC